MDDIRLRLAIAMSVFCSVVTAMYVRARVEPVPIMAWLLSAGPTLLVVLWIVRDARRRHIAAVHDLGFFLAVFWPFAIPWYAVASRGRAGWKLLLGLLGIIAAPFIAGLICAAIG